MSYIYTPGIISQHFRCPTTSPQTSASKSKFGQPKVPPKPLLYHSSGVPRGKLWQPKPLFRHIPEVSQHIKKQVSTSEPSASLYSRGIQKQVGTSETSAPSKSGGIASNSKASSYLRNLHFSSIPGYQKQIRTFETPTSLPKSAPAF